MREAGGSRPPALKERYQNRAPPRREIRNEGVNQNLKTLRYLSALWALCFLGGIADAALAVSTAYKFTGGTSLEVGDEINGTGGFEFKVSGPILVTRLGFWDRDEDGLIQEHSIGLFDLGGTLLASAVVGPGASDALDNGFRYADITPYLLNPGIYRIGAYIDRRTADSDDVIVGDPTIVTDPLITYIRSVGTGSDFLVYPEEDTTDFAGLGFFGPNFQFTAVPEPSCVVLLMGLGVAGTTLSLRRRKA
jgi:hypothetical protein